MDIEAYLRDFEEECDCVLSVHDLGRVFVDAESNKLLPAKRSSHRKRIAICNTEDRQYCIKCCMTRLNRRIQQRHETSFIKRCRKGVLEVVAPLYRDQIHVVTLFAGVWQSRFRKQTLELNPVERQKMERLKRLLPIFGKGLLEHIFQIRFQGKKEFNRKAEIRNFIIIQAAESVSLQDLATSLRLSPSRTCHLVKECFGKTFNALLAQERIERARQLLISTDYRMNEIAEIVGLGTPEHFSRTFHKYSKISPREYRNRYQLILE
jgi:AraC-like DNA-binding protein